MNKLLNSIRSLKDHRALTAPATFSGYLRSISARGKTDAAPHPFRVMVNKEVSDHVRSWRFIILLGLILLTCFSSLYTSLSGIGTAVKANDPNGSFFFLKLFTLSDGTLPSFTVFIGFLGPLLGISMGFDAVNAELNRGTLTRILAQPVHRDYLLNAKFTGALMLIGTLFFCLTFLVMGLGLIIIGIPPTADEFLRIIFFTILNILYVAFWLNLSILFSVRFRQAATSALTSIAVWLFFTVFFQIIINLFGRMLISPDTSVSQEFSYRELIRNLLTFSPSRLYSDASTTLLLPSVRSLGPLTLEKMVGTIPGPLPAGQSLLLVWPQLTGLMAATVLCFALSYYSFMKKEIRSR
jgi:ABC-2 type transport system permease protein